MTELRLHVTLEPHGPATAILLSDEQVAAFNAGKAFPVLVTINGNSFRGRCCRMGGVNMIGLSKAARGQLGVEIGDEVDVVVTHDAQERVVTPPPELDAALAADPSAKSAYDALSFTRRKELAASIADAKRPQTKQARLEKILQELGIGSG